MIKKLLIPSVAALGVVAGIAGANIAANAESSTTTTTNTTTGGSTTAPSGPHQFNGKTETALTGTDLEKATAAAQAKVSGGTVVRAETDADGDGTYEVHMKDSSGKMVTVFLDSNYAVTSQTDGMSAKNPGIRGNSGPQASDTTTSTSN